MRGPTLSVVIPTHNGRHLLASCLGSLRDHRPDGVDLEVIVADDASTDDTADWIATEHPEARVVPLPTNVGFCAAANAGIAAARGEFIQLLNNDAEVLPGWLEAGLAPFDDPLVGSVAPLVAIRSRPTRVDSAGDAYAFFGWPSKRGHGESIGHWARRPVEEVFGASASSAFYRADALRSVGAFDPSYGSYYEDVDLAFRLRWAGYRCVYAPSCRILHDVSATYHHGSSSLHRRMSRNAEALFWSNLPAVWLVLAILPRFAFLAAQLVWKLSRGQARAFLAGKAAAFRSIPMYRHQRSRRRAIARTAIARPNFRIDVVPIGRMLGHLFRASGMQGGPDRTGRPTPPRGFGMSDPSRVENTLGRILE